MNRSHLLPVLVVLAGCSSAPTGNAVDLVWPPRGIDAPAEFAYRGRVAAFAPAGIGRLLATLAGGTQAPGVVALRRPTSVAILASRMAVADIARGSVTVSDLDGRSARTLALPFGTIPVAVAAGGTPARFFVADGPTGTVHAFAPDASAKGAVTLEPGSVGRCGGLAVTSGGDLLLTDVERGAVLRISPDGALRARQGNRGGAPGQFNFPTAVAEAPDGTVWVLDTMNFRAVHLDHRLAVLGSFGQLGDGSGHFALPKGLAVDPDGHLLVSDAIFDVVQVFDSEGRLLLILGRRGNGPGEFWNPGGLACDRAGTVAIADSGNGRVQLFDYRRRGGTP